MKVRSWMAAVVLVAGSMVLLAGMARSQKTGSDTSPTAANQNSGTAKTQPGPNPSDLEKQPAPKSSPIKLSIMIAGLGQDGGEVEITPGNQGTRFKPQRLRVDARGDARFVIQDMEARGADHNCTFAITVREAGQASRTIYRGFRMVSRSAAEATSQPAQSFTCYMNSPSKLVGLDQSDRTRR